MLSKSKKNSSYNNFELEITPEQSMQEIVDASRKLSKRKLENQQKKRARKSKRDKKKSMLSLSSVA